MVVDSEAAEEHGRVKVIRICRKRAEARRHDALHDYERIDVDVGMQVESLMKAHDILESGFQEPAWYHL